MSRRSGEEDVLSWQGSEGVRSSPETSGSCTRRGHGQRWTADDELIDDLQNQDKPRCRCRCRCRYHNHAKWPLPFDGSDEDLVRLKQCLFSRERERERWERYINESAVCSMSDSSSGKVLGVCSTDCWD